MLNLCIVRAWITYLTAFLLILSPLSASAQPSGWDASLDRYESICNQCIELRQRSLAGEAVSSASITDLLGQLASLRRALQASAGQMSPSQRARFDSIRLRYSEAFPSSASQPAGRQAFGPSIVSPSILPSLPSSTAMLLSSCSRSSILATQPSDASTSASSFGSALSSPSLSASASSFASSFEPVSSVGSNFGPSRPEARFGLIAYGVFPYSRPGLMARLDVGRMGLFVKGSWRPAETAQFTCQSDGTTSSGYIWTSGQESVGGYDLSAGATYAIVSGFGSGKMALRAYAGAGYGRQTVLWEDSSGRWAEVSDLSPSGLSSAAGLLFDFGHLSLTTGLSSVAFQTLSFELGLGLLF